MVQYPYPTPYGGNITLKTKKIKRGIADDEPYIASSKRIILPKVKSYAIFAIFHQLSKRKRRLF